MPFTAETIEAHLGPNVVVFDTETTSPHRSELRLTVAAAWSSVTNQYHVFWEDELPLLGALLDSATTIVAHNSTFDIGVMQEYFGKEKAEQWWLKVFDLFELIKNREGTWVGVNALAITNGLDVKIGNGSGAIVQWNEGRLADLALYCVYDVKILCELLAMPELQYCISRYATDTKGQRHCGYGMIDMNRGGLVFPVEDPAQFPRGKTSTTCACVVMAKMKAEAVAEKEKKEAVGAEEEVPLIISVAKKARSV